MKSEDRTTAYGVGAILVALSLMTVALWVAVGFIYDLWKDDDE